MNYLDIGYDKFLNKITGERDRMTSNQFDLFVPTISGDKIDTEIDGKYIGSGVSAEVVDRGAMLLDRIRGGIGFLGGTGNQYGYVRVFDENLLESLRIDSSGLTVPLGGFTFKNNSGKSIIDDRGIVSTSFLGDIVSDTNAFTTTNTSYTDVTNMTLNFSVSRGVKIIVGASVVGQNDSIATTNVDNCYTAIMFDGSQVGATMVTPGFPGSSVIPQAAGTTALVNAAAGHHNLKLQTKAVSAGTARLVATEPKVLWYVILGM